MILTTGWFLPKARFHFTISVSNNISLGGASNQHPTSTLAFQEIHCPVKM
jgi:hypothetical protein